MTGFRRHITRESIAGDQKDIVSGFFWEFIVNKWPNAVYYPGDQVFKTRLMTCSPPSDISSAPLETNLHGFDIIMPGDIARSGSCGGVFQDFIDQSIINIFQDWSDKTQDAETRLSLPKSELYMDASVFQLDRQLNPIRMWEMRTGLLENWDCPPNFGGDNNIGGQVSFSIKFEFIKPKVLNK